MGVGVGVGAGVEVGAGVDVGAGHAGDSFPAKIHVAGMAGSHDGSRRCVSRPRRRFIHAFLIFLSTTLTPPLHADYQSGLNAYLAGDYGTAMTEWQEVAAGSRLDEAPTIYAETHYAIAMLYWQGLGTRQDYQEAYKWLLKAAQMNHAGAQTKLGYLYAEGISTPQDYEQAFRWYSQAARQGDVDAQYNLGIFYLNGWGTEADRTLAKQYLAAASAQGDAAAEEALQHMLYEDFAGYTAADAGAESSEHPEPDTIADESIQTGDGNDDAGADSSAIESDRQTDPNALATFVKISPGGDQPNQETNRGQGPLLLGSSWILEQDPDHYTLQVIALSSREKVEALIQPFGDLAPFALYTVPGDNKTLHVLLQGNFANVDAARKARDRFPRAIQSADQLWIRQFAKVQELVRE